MSKSQVSQVLIYHFRCKNTRWVQSFLLDSDSDRVCRDCSSWTGQQPLMIGFTELPQAELEQGGNNRSDKWDNIYKFYLRNYDHHNKVLTLDKAFEIIVELVVSSKLGKSNFTEQQNSFIPYFAT